MTTPKINTETKRAPFLKVCVTLRFLRLMKSTMRNANHRRNLTGIFTQFLDACSAARASFFVARDLIWSGVP